VQSAEAATRTVTLSYLARAFDWAADYTATVSADGTTMDLGAWVTLANGNGVGFPSAHTQVVAGRVNRESGEVEPLDVGGPILAQCWPRGSTSDPPQYLQLAGAAPLGAAQDSMAKVQSMAAAAPRLEGIALTAQRNVEQEQLGDLKLYRVPDRTTVASRQSKQVRLLDRSSIPIARVYGADLAADENAAPAPAHVLLRTKNIVANHLGLPLPSGHVAVFIARDGAALLQQESNLRDLAVEEEVEIDMGVSSDVQLTVVRERTGTDSAKVAGGNRVDISNARATDIQFELRLRLPEGSRIARADHSVGTKNGRPIFRLTIPANGTVTLRYQWHSAG
jgi:hypothetical protein